MTIPQNEKLITNNTAVKSKKYTTELVHGLIVIVIFILEYVVWVDLIFEKFGTKRLFIITYFAICLVSVVFLVAALFVEFWKRLRKTSENEISRKRYTVALVFYWIGILLFIASRVIMWGFILL